MVDPVHDSSKLRDKAYASFTQHLMSNDLNPGQFISQRELVALTGLTLGAIRELIPRLEAEGLIRTVPQRGMQIANIDLALVRDAFQFRIILEREAAANFAKHAPDEMIQSWIDAHQAILTKAESGVTPELVKEAQAIDDGFHEAVVGFMGNAIMANAYRINSIKIRLIRQNRTRLQQNLVVPVMQEHQKLLDALMSRDPIRAADAFTDHISNARERALSMT
jgi:DNA-binding GntR family transcriptional regulator